MLGFFSLWGNMQIRVRAIAFGFFRKGLPLIWISEILCFLTEYWKQRLLQKNGMYHRVHEKSNFNPSSTERISTSAEDIKLNYFFFVHTLHALECRVSISQAASCSIKLTVQYSAIPWTTVLQKQCLTAIQWQGQCLFMSFLLHVLVYYTSFCGVIAVTKIKKTGLDQQRSLGIFTVSSQLLSWTVWAGLLVPNPSHT